MRKARFAETSRLQKASKNIFRYFSVLIFCSSFLAAASCAFAAQSETREEFQHYLQGLHKKASDLGVSNEVFHEAFDDLTLDPRVIAQTKKQAEFSKPIWQYLEMVVTASRMSLGQKMARKYKSWLDKAERDYGVDSSIILGVWGIETNFGQNSGSMATIRSLASLAYVRYRDGFFEDELLAALQILQQQHFRSGDLTGSWAGAMGQTQFMPSSYLKYAVDFNGDGRKDIWTSVPDAIGSSANYLQQHGWIRGETWGYEVILPAHFDIMKHDPARFFPFSRFAEDGVKRADEQPMPRRGEAALLMPAGLHGPAFLVTPNFKVIKSYNNSTSYALAVSLLADASADNAGVLADWPGKSLTLTGEQAMEVQKRLHAMGYPVGKIDGNLGEQAGIAIRAYQKKIGFTPDGYATPALLEKMRKGAK